MRRILIYRRVAFAMAALMFLTSVSFSVDMHFCQDHLKSLSLFGKAKACYEKEVCHQEATGETTISKKPCCTDKTSIIEALDYQSSSQLSQSTKHVLPGELVTIKWPLQSSLVVSCLNDFDLYKPPLPDRDVLVLFQRFLI